MVYRPAPIHHIGSASKDVPSGHSQNDSWKARHYGIFSAVRHSWLSWWVERNTENSAKFQVDMSCTLWTVLHTETHLTFCATQLSLFKVAYVPRGRKLTSTHGRGQWKKNNWSMRHVGKHSGEVKSYGKECTSRSLKPSDVLVSCCFLF